MSLENRMLGEEAKTEVHRRRTTFAGDVLRLVSGNMLAQLVVVLTAPLLTRFYAPDAFGILALFSAITGIVGVVASLRYELAIMLPETDREAANLLAGSIGLVFVTSGLFSIVLWLGGTPLLHLLNAEALAPYLWLMPVMVLVTGAFTVLNYWNSRTKQFARLSVARVTNAVSTATAAVSAGAAGMATAGMMVGAEVGGQGLTTAILAGQIWRDDRRLFRRSIRWSLLVASLKRYKEFPQYNTWSALLNTISWRLPAFMLAAFFSTSVVGYYALGFRILQIPMGLIGASINQVFFQRAAIARHHDDLAVLVEEVFRRLVMIGMFPMLVLTIIGQDLYVFVFGASWAEAGVYTQILALWAFFWFISSPLSTVWVVQERQRFGLVLNIVVLVSRVAALGIGGYLGNPRLAILLYAISGVIVYGFVSIANMVMAGVPLPRIWVILGVGFAYFLPFGIFLLLISFLGGQGLPLLAAAAVSSIGYALILWKRQPDLFRFDFDIPSFT